MCFKGEFQPVCPEVLVKCKSSNIQHENVGVWFEFLRQIPSVNIAIIHVFYSIAAVFDFKDWV